MKNIVETAVGAGNFETLVMAIKKASLVETLSGEGPFTVFAPDDAAFAKVPKEMIDELMDDDEKLKKVLTYHVVSGKTMSGDLSDGEMIGTLEGEDLMVKIDGSKVTIDNAMVKMADIVCSNGVIHVIDSVLMPKA